MHSTDLMTGLITGVLLIAGSAPIATAAPTTYAVVESKSTLTIQVGKSGVFSFAGHKHEVAAPVAGTVTADAANVSGSSVELAFKTARMSVLTATGETTLLHDQFGMERVSAVDGTMKVANEFGISFKIVAEQK